MLPHAAEKTGFVPGQVAVLEMAGRKPSYLAFASAPEDREYEFLVKQSDWAESIANGLFVAGAAAEITLSNIVGNGFPMENFVGRDLVFVAMGTGIAPLRSTLRHVFRRRNDFGKLIVLHGARTNKDFYFEDEIASDWRTHDVTLRQVISQPNDEWSGDTGYVQSLLDNIVPELHNPVALICGSSEMMKQTKERLQELGFADENILTNY
jgi:sulfhydrogenase subunit gamma (sulfur reductase)